MPFLISKLYFWYSLIYLIVRSLCVFYFASGIHDASRKPALILRNLAPKAYSAEVLRFLDVVNGGIFALSGMKLFYLTRSLILAVSKSHHTNFIRHQIIETISNVL